MALSSEEMYVCGIGNNRSREKNDGIGINLGHYLNDCLWQCTQIE